MNQDLISNFKFRVMASTIRIKCLPSLCRLHGISRNSQSLFLIFQLLVWALIAHEVSAS